MRESSLQSTQYRRTVVVDIETVTLDPNLAKGALDALTGRIVCIGMLIDDGAQLEELTITHENEVHILTKFWATIRPTDVIVGHNVHEFDIPFIRQRSWILGIRPSRTIDLRKFYTATCGIRCRFGPTGRSRNSYLSTRLALRFNAVRKAHTVWTLRSGGQSETCRLLRSTAWAM